MPQDTATAVDMAAVGMPKGAVNGPEEPLDWDAIDWRAENKAVRRLRKRIFKAAQAGDWKQTRNLQKLCDVRSQCVSERNIGRIDVVDVLAPG
jgi:RNA-directed DNA polymerase